MIPSALRRGAVPWFAGLAGFLGGRPAAGGVPPSRVEDVRLTQWLGCRQLEYGAAGNEIESRVGPLAKARRVNPSGQ